MIGDAADNASSSAPGTLN